MDESQAGQALSDQQNMINTETFLARLSRDETCVGTWLMFPSPPVAELVAHVGFDWVLIDTEHANVSAHDAQSLLRAISGTQVVPFVRAAWNDPILIKQVLDGGTAGIVIPQVNSADEAQAAVRACRFPPLGDRGLGASRANVWGTRFGPDYTDEANRETIVVIQIEDNAGVENAEDILAVPGIDVVYIGVADLMRSMGYGAQGEPCPPDVEEAIASVVTIAKRRGIPLGVHAATPQIAAERIVAGFRLVALGGDYHFLYHGARDALLACRGATSFPTITAATGDLTGAR